MKIIRSSSHSEDIRRVKNVHKKLLLLTKKNTKRWRQSRAILKKRFILLVLTYLQPMPFQSGLNYA